jgi:cysteine synthase
VLCTRHRVSRISAHTSLADGWPLLSQEILADFPEGVDYVITGVGTGGHITGEVVMMMMMMMVMMVVVVEAI